MVFFYGSCIAIPLYTSFFIVIQQGSRAPPAVFNCVKRAKDLIVHKQTQKYKTFNEVELQ